MSSTDALGDAHATIGTMTSDQLLPNSTASFTCCLQLPVSKVIRQSYALNSILVCTLTIGTNPKPWDPVWMQEVRP